MGDEVGPRRSAVEAGDDAVGGEDGDAGGVHVDKGHHHGGFGVGGAGELRPVGMLFSSARFGGRLVVFGAAVVEGEVELGGALPGVGDGGLVAVVAVGDDELFVGHGGDDEVDEVGVGEAPEAVDDTLYSSVMVRSGGGSERGLRHAEGPLSEPKMSFSAVKAGSE